MCLAPVTGFAFRSEQDTGGTLVTLCDSCVFPLFLPMEIFTKLCMQTGIFVCFT